MDTDIISALIAIIVVLVLTIKLLINLLKFNGNVGKKIKQYLRDLRDLLSGLV
ncbi:hypothetical protein C8D90_101357 [Enterobacillus tribolii]|uniref:Uncharacterized protein n=1 Tax=Enterobacillus tribolii TaxID=1487935 RepID=A0A370R3A6_9GAMM|nr:hypothetical protein C8D90_101357 [Enterobacillus tribolii]